MRFLFQCFCVMFTLKTYAFPKKLCVCLQKHRNIVFIVSSHLIFFHHKRFARKKDSQENAANMKALRIEFFLPSCVPLVDPKLRLNH